MSRWLTLFVLAIFSLHAAALDITLAGEVSQPGTVTVAEDSRINTVLEKFAVNEDAFFLGAAWFRKAEQEPQLRLKNGLLFDLQILQKNALLDNQKELAALADKLNKQFLQLPVTGRIKHNLDPSALLATDINHLLQDGDSLYYPARPSNITIMGATEKNCTVAFTALKTADDYLAQCRKTRFADNNFIIVIQPDGKLFKDGIALWNRGEKTAIAPGAIILVPVSERLLDKITLDLNQEMADFLATQSVDSDQLFNASGADKTP